MSLRPTRDFKLSKSAVVVVNPTSARSSVSSSSSHVSEVILSFPRSMAKEPLKIPAARANRRTAPGVGSGSSASTATSLTTATAAGGVAGASTTFGTRTGADSSMDSGSADLRRLNTTTPMPKSRTSPTRTNKMMGAEFIQLASVGVYSFIAGR